MRYSITWENRDRILILSMQVTAPDIHSAIDAAHVKLSHLFSEELIHGWELMGVSELA